MKRDGRGIDDLTQAFLDGDTIDWATAAAKAPGAASLVRQLQVVAAVADAQRNDTDATMEGGPRPVGCAESWGHLRLVEHIGHGAFGDVYRAWDTRLDREVALKLIPAANARSSTASSIIREGRLLARVRHSNVVTIHGADQIDDVVGLWMEFVSGRTLQQLVQDGTVFDPAEVMRIGVELSRALAAVHAAGLLHRDIKAQNVMRAEDGRIVLMDFGTGREFTDARSDLAGTPLYLAPELFNGQAATTQSDVYSLGVLLFYLLTHRVPVEARTLEELRTAHARSSRVDLRSVRPDVPAPLARIIERCLDSEPDKRYPTADALRMDLEPASAPPQRRRPWYVAAAIGVLAVLAWMYTGSGLFDGRPFTSDRDPSGPLSAGTTAFGWFFPRRDPPISARVSLGVDEPLAEGPLLSPNGAYLTFTTRTASGLRLYVKAFSRNDPILIASSRQFVFQPFFSPDSSFVGFFDGGRMWKASVRGGARTPIADSLVQPAGASWGDDGFILYAPTLRSGLWRVAADGGTPRQVTTPDDTLGETGHAYPLLLPGSRVAIFRAQRRSWKESSLVAYSVDNTRRVAIVPDEPGGREDAPAYKVELSDRRQLAEGGSSPQYTSEGQLVYLEGSTLIARRFDASRLDGRGPRIPVLSDVWTFSVSQTGSLLYRSRPKPTPNSWLVWVNRDGSFERVAGLPPEISHARICPADPRRLVFERYDHIWTYNAATGALNRLTSLYSNTGPVWTPNCDRIFFSASRKEPGLDVVSIAADGSGNETAIPEAGAQDHVDVARNGSWLAYETMNGIGRKGPLRDVWLRQLTRGATSRRLTPGREATFDPALSPDGRWVAYASDETDSYEVYIRAADGSAKRRVSFTGGREPLWNPNGQEIFYRQGDKVMAANVRITAGRVDIGNTTVLFEGPYKPAGVSSRSYDITADGNRFLMVRREPPQPTPAPVITLVTNWAQDLARRASTRSSR